MRTVLLVVLTLACCSATPTKIVRSSRCDRVVFRLVRAGAGFASVRPVIIIISAHDNPI